MLVRPRPAFPRGPDGQHKAEGAQQGTCSLGQAHRPGGTITLSGRGQSPPWNGGSLSGWQAAAQGLAPSPPPTPQSSLSCPAPSAGPLNQPSPRLARVYGLSPQCVLLASRSVFAAVTPAAPGYISIVLGGACASRLASLRPHLGLPVEWEALCLLSCPSVSTRPPAQVTPGLPRLDLPFTVGCPSPCPGLAESSPEASIVGPPLLGGWGVRAHTCAARSV